MKYSFCLFVFCLFILLLSCSQTHESKEGSLAIKEKVQINNFVPQYVSTIPEIELPFKNYNGFKIEGYLVDGIVDSNKLKQGYWKIVDKKNNLKFQGIYLNGKKNGWWEIFLDNKLICCGIYELDKKQGYWRYFGLNFETKKFVTYYYDTLVGLAREYTKDSILLSDGMYKKGLKDGYWKFFYNSGTIKEQGYFEDNYKSGWWQNYDSFGKLVEEARYSQDEISGYVKRYTNGILTEEGKQFNGKKRGTWKFYNAQGKQNKIIEYEE